MHSFRPSRSRILFEVFCALAMSACCVGAWMQTGAWALLPAAVVAALFGLVHAFDMVGRRAAVAVEPQRIDFAADDQGDLLAYEDAGAPLVATDQQIETVERVKEAELGEPVAAGGRGGRRSKAPRKGRVSTTKKTKVAELAPPEEAEVAKLAPPEEAEVELPTPFEEAAHMQIEPLFEPDPFVRQQRMVFGRKAR
jgi:hypothetical protein